MNGDSSWHYVWIGLCAFFGVLARSARWTTPDGSIDWRKALFECLTAPAIVAIAAAFGTWQGVDTTILGGISALLGLLGPAAIESIALRWFNSKIGAG